MKKMALAVAASARQIGRSVGVGASGGARKPERPVTCSVPHTRVPAAVFDLEFQELEARRWAYADHIHLGEGRAAVRLCELVGRFAPLRGRVYASLQDNQTFQGAATKGRSSAPALNYLLRKKASVCVVSDTKYLLPWVESRLQPADEASRRVRPALSLDGRETRCV